jgi:hypothetical protein
MDNATLIRSFVESVVAGKNALMSNAELRIEPIGDTLQLWAKQEGMVSSARPTQKAPKTASVILKDKTHYWPTLHNTLLENSFLPTHPAPSKGFYQYEFAKVPPSYEVNYTDGLLLLQAWWQYRQQEDRSGLLGMLVWHGRTWYPVRNIDCTQGTLSILSWGNEISVQPSERVVWLLKVEPKPESSKNTAGSEATSIHSAQSSSGVEESQATAAENSVPSPSLSSSSKCIGNYLLEAGLLSAAQVDVILSDQASTGMRFGEIAVSRGWLKEQTIEYLMKHLIMPQQSLPLDLNEDQVEDLPNEVVERLKELSPKSIHERDTLVISGRTDEDPPKKG